jgi:hypothetical protein
MGSVLPVLEMGMQRRFPTAHIPAEPEPLPFSSAGPSLATQQCVIDSRA